MLLNLFYSVLFYIHIYIRPYSQQRLIRGAPIAIGHWKRKGLQKASIRGRSMRGMPSSEPISSVFCLLGIKGCSFSLINFCLFLNFVCLRLFPLLIIQSYITCLGLSGTIYISCSVIFSMTERRFVLVDFLSKKCRRKCTRCRHAATVPYRYNGPSQPT